MLMQQYFSLNINSIKYVSKGQRPQNICLKTSLLIEKSSDRVIC